MILIMQKKVEQLNNYNLNLVCHLKIEFILLT